MTRTAAMLLSIFGPIIPVCLVLLFFASFDEKPPVAVGALGALLFVAAALTIRVYFAAWYARDKGRSGALGLIALFGLLGWLFLLVTEDRKFTGMSSGPVGVDPALRPTGKQETVR